MFSQISVPHNEIDKVDRGGLDKMTLVEVYDTHPVSMSSSSTYIRVYELKTWK